MRLSLSLPLVNRGREDERGGARREEEREGERQSPLRPPLNVVNRDMIYLAFLVLFLPGKRLIFELWFEPLNCGLESVLDDSGWQQTDCSNAFKSFEMNHHF